MPESITTPTSGLVQAAVVTVEYSGHDCEVKVDSLWATFEEAEARKAELDKANEEFGDEQHFAVDLPPAVLL